ncbi:MAG: hypothetical protein H6735_08025 [Alphaproteobacteria bacterium]|nr:hypothetical protein [Alphaproteobacteria bacterium]
MKETDLYLPIKRFLESRGRSVKGEVADCDVVAVAEGEEPVVVELKLHLNLDLLLQGVDRLAVAGLVYLAVPSSCAVLRTRRARALKLLRMLGLGLLAVAGERVEVLLDPGPYVGPRRSGSRRARVLGEFSRRVGDPTAGGVDRRRGWVTAYRQRALAIAVHLRDHGPTRAREVAAAVGDDRARVLLYRDVFGWFTRVSTGVYALSARGARELPEWSAVS